MNLSIERPESVELTDTEKATAIINAIQAIKDARERTGCSLTAGAAAVRVWREANPLLVETAKIQESRRTVKQQEELVVRLTGELLTARRVLATMKRAAKLTEKMELSAEDVKDLKRFTKEAIVDEHHKARLKRLGLIEYSYGTWHLSDRGQSEALKRGMI